MCCWRESARVREADVWRSVIVDWLRFLPRNTGEGAVTSVWKMGSLIRVGSWKLGNNEIAPLLVDFTIGEP